MPEFTKIEAHTWHRFDTPNLFVSAELIGEEHSFRFRGHAVKITLPPAEKAGLKTVIDLGQDQERPRLILHTWREGGETKIPQDVGVKDVDVSVRVPRAIRIIRTSSESSSTDVLPILPEDKPSLDVVGEALAQVELAAFEYWLRLMRWRSRKGDIGRTVPRIHLAGSNTHIVEPKTGRHLSVGKHAVSVIMPEAITPGVWQLVAESLRNGEDSPLYYDRYFDATAHLRMRALQSAVVDAAVASEVYMRSRVSNHVPSTVVTPLRDLIDDANIQGILEKVFPALLSAQGQAAYRKLKSKLHALFHTRNKILHSGRLTDLEQARTYCQVVSQLLLFDEHMEYWI